MRPFEDKTTYRIAQQSENLKRIELLSVLTEMMLHGSASTIDLHVLSKILATSHSRDYTWETLAQWPAVIVGETGNRSLHN